MTQSIRSIEQLNRLSPSERRALLKDAVRRTKESPESSAGPKICPTSFAQQRLWFLDRLMGESRFYNIANAVRIAGQINVIALEGGANEIVQRHEALRTSFALIDGTPAQVVARSLNIRLPLVDLSGLSADEIDGEVKRLAMEQIARPFDLSRLPLIRISLLHTAVNEHVAVMTMHHIISDGWSMTVLIRELGSLYHGIVNGEPSRLRALRAQYSDFARWQRIHCAGPASEDHLRYWRERLKGLTPLDLLADRPRPPALTHRGATRTVVFSEDLSRSLRTIGRT
ncbi:MAG TPA: condensation domain-containing protein, partial [Blastocatellia bacterium]|nr:condensation domain-containing protein [Blastocatellia bacterium]